MMMTTTGRARRTALVLAMALLGAVAIAETPATAIPGDQVRVWNAHASNALFNLPSAATFPGAGQALQGLLHLAMVQGAVYDAVNAIDGGHEPYLDGLPAASPTASIDAAAATAAHDVLAELTNPVTDVVLLPPATMDWLEAEYTASLGSIADGAAKTDGIAIGAAAADAMLAARSDDGRYVTFSFTQGTGIGEWRDTGSGSDPIAWLANVDPFLIESTSQFRTDGPNPVESDAYARDYAEVKTLGAATGSSRTPEQTALGIFYRENSIVLFNRTFRGLTAAQGLGPVEEARLFAMLNLTAADAAINCWDDKAHWGFWRPITAIHAGNVDGNPDTVVDATWAPLGVPPLVGGTPPYPDHPSGYNCLTGAMMSTAKDFYGTNRIAFTVHSNSANADRDYVRFSEVFKDTIDARVYLGIHFRTADVQAVVLGKKVAAWVDRRYFGPVE